MEDQFIDFPFRTEVEFHSEAFKLVDDEGPALVGTEFVCWLSRNCQRELIVVVLPDNNSYGSLTDEGAGAVLTKGGIRAIAAGKAGEDDVFDERLERIATLATFPSRSEENEMVNRLGCNAARRLPARASGSSNVS